MNRIVIFYFRQNSWSSMRNFKNQILQYILKSFFLELLLEMQMLEILISHKTCNC